MQEEFKRIPVKNIIADPNQPRKHFDEGKLAELAESIRQNDVIEPLLVRRTKSRNKESYMLVVGERRYRASLLAEMVDVPCMIRNLNDVQALEVQITENLQREDINPMEEAHAFKSIIKNKTYSVEALAARLGKRSDYVRQRMRLCELILSWQELLYASRLRITDANVLCRFGLDQQVAFYNQYVPKEWEKQPEGWVLPAMQLSEKTKNLDEAPFKTEDPNLNPLMGVCGKCTYNSQVSQLPFAGQEGSRTCSNPACYHIKEQNSHRQKLEEAANSNILLISGGTYTPQAKEQVKQAEETGRPVLSHNDYEILTEPELLSADKYEKQYSWRTKDKTDEEKQELYAEYVQGVEVKKAEFDFKKSRAQQAFVVAGDYGAKTGEMIEVYVPQPEPDAIAREQEVAGQVAKLLQQKTMSIAQANKDFLKDLAAGLRLANTYWNNEKPLEIKDTLAIFQLFIDTDFSEADTDAMFAEWGSTPHPKTEELLTTILTTSKACFMYKWMRRLVVDKITEYDITDAGGLSLRLLAERYIPRELEALQNQYKEKQKEIIAGIGEKIAALQQQALPMEEAPEQPAAEGAGAFVGARKSKGLKALLEPLDK